MNCNALQAEAEEDADEKVARSNVPFVKGQRRPPQAGRKAGTPNKASVPWKALVTTICESPKHQRKLEAACLERPDLMFKAAEHAFGKPKETVELRGDFRMIQWPDNEDIPEK